MLSIFLDFINPYNWKETQSMNIGGIWVYEMNSPTQKTWGNSTWPLYNFRNIQPSIAQPPISRSCGSKVLGTFEPQAALIVSPGRNISNRSSTKLYASVRVENMVTIYAAVEFISDTREDLKHVIVSIIYSRCQMVPCVTSFAALSKVFSDFHTQCDDGSLIKSSPNIS